MMRRFLLLFALMLVAAQSFATVSLVHKSSAQLTGLTPSADPLTFNFTACTPGDTLVMAVFTNGYPTSYFTAAGEGGDSTTWQQLGLDISASWVGSQAGSTLGFLFTLPTCGSPVSQVVLTWQDPYFVCCGAPSASVQVVVYELTPCNWAGPDQNDLNQNLFTPSIANLTSVILSGSGTRDTFYIALTTTYLTNGGPYAPNNTGTLASVGGGWTLDTTAAYTGNASAYLIARGNQQAVISTSVPVIWGIAGGTFVDASVSVEEPQIFVTT